MTDSIQIPYNKNFAYFGLTFIIGMIAISFPYLVKDLHSDDRHNLTFVVFLDAIIFVMLLLFIIKFFIPSIKGLTALELNRDAIIDNVRHRKIYWDNVSGIRMTFSGSSSGIAIDTIDKEKVEEQKNVWNRFQSLLAQVFFGTPFVISNKFIEGSDKEIFAQVIVYFERQKNCT